MIIVAVFTIEYVLRRTHDRQSVGSIGTLVSISTPALPVALSPK